MCNTFSKWHIIVAISVWQRTEFGTRSVLLHTPIQPHSRHWHATHSHMHKYICMFITMCKS